VRRLADRPFIVVNHFAAGARPAWEHIRKALVDNDINFDVYVSSVAGEIETYVRSALREGYYIIGVVGGDGTLSEVTRGFFERPVLADSPPLPINPAAKLAILPAGTGDDFARGLTGYRAPMEKWLERLITHCRLDEGRRTTRSVDALYVTVSNGSRSFVCLNAATLGISADVIKRVASQNGLMRRLSGEKRFLWGAIGAITAWRNRMVRITVDDCSMECSTNLLAVVNGQYVGGGMKFVPSARPDDGFLDVIMACGVTRMQAVRELMRIHHGGHLANPKIIFKKGARAQIETFNPVETLIVEADGDVRGHTPAEFRLMPCALRLVW
jgi:diacylglycerol kinase (ATP)